MLKDSRPGPSFRYHPAFALWDEKTWINSSQDSLSVIYLSMVQHTLRGACYVNILVFLTYQSIHEPTTYSQQNNLTLIPFI